MASHAVLLLQGALLGKRLQVPGNGAIAIFGVYALDPAVVDFFFKGTTREVEPGAVVVVPAAVCRRGPDHRGRRVGHQAEAFLALAQRLGTAQEFLLETERCAVLLNGHHEGVGFEPVDGHDDHHLRGIRALRFQPQAALLPERPAGRSEGSNVLTQLRCACRQGIEEVQEMRLHRDQQPRGLGVQHLDGAVTSHHQEPGRDLIEKAQEALVLLPEGFGRHGQAPVGRSTTT